MKGLGIIANVSASNNDNLVVVMTIGVCTLIVIVLGIITGIKMKYVKSLEEVKNETNADEAIKIDTFDVFRKHIPDLWKSGVRLAYHDGMNCIDYSATEDLKDSDSVPIEKFEKYRYILAFYNNSKVTGE